MNLLVLTLLLADPVRSDVVGLIRGGKAGDLPTAVALTLKDDKFKEIFCGGTILSKKIILTAAHCMDAIKDDDNLNVDNLEVVAGDPKLFNYRRGQKGFEKIFSVRRAVVHPNYDKEMNGNYAWDLAILELNEDIDFESNPRIDVAHLPPPEVILTGQKITVGGWGRTVGLPEQIFNLSVIQVPVNHPETCEDNFGDEFVKENMFCAGDKTKTACEGDSGSGATISVNDKTYLLGVVSFGVDESCRVMAGFQKIGPSLPWIFMETGLT